MSDIEELPVKSGIRCLDELPRMEPEKLFNPPREMTMVERLIDRGELPDIASLEKLIELQNTERERQAKRDFDIHFAEMQSEFVAVKRDKKGYDYNYAPIETLQKAYGPIIAKHGFSYRWREVALEVGKRCILTISGHGHQEENSFDIPPITGTKQMNAVQIAGAQSTYGRRYTFIAGFGVIIEDEDSDAATFEDGVKYANHLDLIAKSGSLDELKVNAKTASDSVTNDSKGKKILAEAYNKRKRELSKND